ncbi:MAG: hypothetical protein GWN54_12240, partial [Gammaproteobacteria bacterium]|nr:hypothetical protein [Gammaproteobacteria bacterium]
MTSLVRGAWDSFKRLLGAAWSTPAVRRGIVILLLIDVLWMLWFAVARILYITEIDPSWYAMRKLRITADGSIPEWINYGKTLAIVVLLGGLL